MYWIIPALGKGVRFSNYLEEKPFIKINGVSMIERVVENLEGNIFIICNKDVKERMDKLFLGYDKVKIKAINPTIGAGETIHIATQYIPTGECFTSVDCDTILDKGIIKKILSQKTNTIWTFYDENKSGIYSYLETDKEAVIGIKEKQPISKIASSGIYTFTSPAEYNDMYLHNNETYNDEVYLSNIISSGLNTGKGFTWKDISGNFNCVGTPHQLEQYALSYKEKKKIVFDLDRTLIVDCKENQTPMLETIEFLNSLYKEGHEITIFTARGMLTHNGDIDEIEKTWRNDIQELLKRFEINYHNLIFGKPYADLYIDDKSISSFRNLNKDTGFYFNSKESRFGNTIKIDDFVSKQGKSTENEYYFYTNVPAEIKNIFPEVISYDGKVLKMEKIEGDTLSHALLSNNINKSDIEKVVERLKSIHIEGDSSEGNLWKGKLEQRFQENKSFYIKLDLMKEVEEALTYTLKESKSTIIHGDPVFTNIIKSSRGLIFIDPRGHDGLKQNIFGPESYDWAKVLQSLCGYDHIIGGCDIPNKQLSDLREHFFSLINEDRIDLYKKTNILILSMLPLHADRMDRVNKYIEMMRDIKKIIKQL